MEFQASVSDCSNPRLCSLFLCIFPLPYCYSNPRRSYHTSSSSHMGVPCLQNIISICHTRLFVYLGFSRLCPSMPTTQPVLPLPSGSGSYCVPISPPILLLPPLSSYESTRVTQSFFDVASWFHHASLMTPHICTLSPLHTPKIRDVALPTAPRLQSTSI